MGIKGLGAPTMLCEVLVAPAIERRQWDLKKHNLSTYHFASDRDRLREATPMQANWNQETYS